MVQDSSGPAAGPEVIPFDRVGDTLKTTEAHYSARYDVTNKQWIILDLWSDELKNLGPEDDLPAGLSAIKSLSELEMDTLLKEADRLGFLRRYVSVPLSAPTSSTPMEAAMQGEMQDLGRGPTTTKTDGEKWGFSPEPPKDPKVVVSSDSRHKRNHEFRMAALKILSQSITGNDIGELNDDDIDDDSQMVSVPWTLGGEDMGSGSIN